MAASLFNRYMWLVDTIYSAGRITQECINERWKHCSYNDKQEPYIPRRTFMTWRNEVEELFHINIVCDRSTNEYYIENKADIENNMLQQWLLNAFTVSNLQSNSEDIRENIILEEVPSGTRYLTMIIDAIRERHVLQVTYQRFDEAEPHRMMLKPFCLKIFKQRWYVAGRSSDHNLEIRIYALDRMHDVKILDTTYKIPKSFSAKRFFRNYYGVFAGGTEKPELVRIKISPKGACYLRSLPLHASQKEIERTDTYSIFTYYLVPTLDFVQELRTHGAQLQVLAPESLVESFRALGKAYRKLYKKPKEESETK